MEEVRSVTIEDNIWGMGVAGEQVVVSARIKNRGADQVGPFNVNIKISDIADREETTLDAQTKQVSSLDPNDLIDLSWTFIPSVSGIYYVNVSTELVNDEVAENDFDDSFR